MNLKNSFGKVTGKILYCLTKLVIEISYWRKQWKTWELIVENKTTYLIF